MPNLFLGNWEQLLSKVTPYITSICKKNTIGVVVVAIVTVFVPWAILHIKQIESWIGNYEMRAFEHGKDAMSEFRRQMVSEISKCGNATITFFEIDRTKSPMELIVHFIQPAGKTDQASMFDGKYLLPQECDIKKVEEVTYRPSNIPTVVTTAELERECKSGVFFSILQKLGSNPQESHYIAITKLDNRLSVLVFTATGALTPHCVPEGFLANQYTNFLRVAIGNY